jgi:hypothetical protein
MRLTAAARLADVSMYTFKKGETESRG